jgi:hypothetical protein
MVGLIWFVQVVHYPLFAHLDLAGIVEHQRRTGWVVGPPMIVEALTAVLLVVERPEGVPATAAWTGLALLAVIWISTALIQVPRHRGLAAGSGEVRRLVAGNWVRTAAWTARGAVVAWMLAAAA